MFRCLLLLMVVCAAAAQPLDDQAAAFIQIHFLAAKRAETQSDFSTAEQEYKTILQKYPKAIPEVYQNIGLVYYLQRKYPDAAAAFVDGLKLNPTMEGARLFLGSSYLFLEQPAKALPHLEAVQKHKASVESSTYLGLAHVALRKYETALPYFKRALDLAEAKADYLYLVGDTYLKLSEQVANGIAEKHPGSEYDQFITAKILDGQEFYQPAVRHYLLAARKDPENASVFYLLARVFFSLGLEEPGQLALGRYRQLMPLDSQAKLDPSTVTRKDAADVGLKIDYAAVLRALPAVESTPPLALIPSSVNVELRKRFQTPGARAALDHLARGRWQEGIQALGRIPPAVSGWTGDYLAAMAHFWKDDYGAAERIVTRRTFAALPHPAAQTLRWQVFHELSLINFQRLLEEHPESSRGHFVKARMYQGQGKKEALEEYQAAIAAGPNQLGMRTALADYLLSTSKYTEAIDASNGELELNPHSAEAKGILGRIYTQLRQPEKAMPHLEAVL
ncbi:MAG: tetratricopeptide repeat protein, partial [Bryobacteraceae bacterium]